MGELFKLEEPPTGAGVPQDPQLTSLIALVQGADERTVARLKALVEVGFELADGSPGCDLPIANRPPRPMQPS